MKTFSRDARFLMVLAMGVTIFSGAMAAGAADGGIPGMTGALPKKSAAAEPAKGATAPGESEKPVSIVHCINPHEAAEMHSPKPEAPVVLKLVQSLADACSSGKIDTISEWLDADCGIFIEETKEHVNGKEAVLKKLKEDFKDDTSGGGVVSSYTIDSPYVKVVGNSAVVTFRAEKLVKGPKETKQQAFVTEMFVKVGDQWKLADMRTTAL